MEKRRNNKGFSLVELIVVVAIMAVLMTVLAPQLLRYVEKTRLQKDNSAIAEIANAIKIAAAEESINNEIGKATASKPIIFVATVNSNAQAISMTEDETNGTKADALSAELQAMFGSTVTMGSNSYNGQTTKLIKIEVVLNNGIPQVTVKNWIAEASGTPDEAGKVFK